MRDTILSSQNNDNAPHLLYLDCLSGISGDMFLGALLELLPLEFDLARTLSAIAIKGYYVEVAREKRGGMAGTKIRVRSDEHEHRHLSDILEILKKSALSEQVRGFAEKAFSLLAEAEARVHGTTAEEIHFHEVGAVDSIIDVVGACLLLEQLGWPRVMASAVNIGSGTVECAHGIMPVPAPATAELLKGIPVRVLGDPMERTTPTGAVLLRVFAQEYGNIPDGIIGGIGVGLGERESDLPNLLRAVLVKNEASVLQRDACLLLEANLDDMNPQDCPPLMEILLEAGARDVWFQPIYMKKGRPAQLLACLAHPDDEKKLTELILRHSTTLGVRCSPRYHRGLLERSIEEISTSWGTVRVKSAQMGNEALRCVPEFEDLKRISKEKNIPLPSLRAQVTAEINKLKR